MKWLTVDTGQECIIPFDMFPLSRTESVFSETAGSDSPEEIANQQEKVFQDVLFSMIDERNLKDAQVYRRAGLDRKYFSKIRTKRGYVPRKNTVISLCLALHLNEEESRYLLASAGYAFIPSGRFDQLVCYCIQKRIYRIYQVNEILYKYTGITL